MSVLELPAPTAEEQAAEDFLPIPQIAPALGTTRLFQYRLAHPVGREWRADFDVERHTEVDGAYIRYSATVPGSLLPIREGLRSCDPGDRLIITFAPGDR